MISKHLAAAVESTVGFMSVNEGEALHDTALSASRGTWLEIGTYCGKSTLMLGDVARTVGAWLVTVDHHHGSEENQSGWEWHDQTLVDPRSGWLDTFPHFRLVLNSLVDVYSAVVADTKVVPAWWNSSVELLFLDGNHTEETAQHDYYAFAKHLVPTGLLLVHDVFPDLADGGQAPWRVVQAARGDGFYRLSKGYGRQDWFF